MKPQRRYLPSLQPDALPEDTPTTQQLIDSVHDLNGIIRFVYEQLAVVAAATATTIQTLED